MTKYTRIIATACCLIIVLIVQVPLSHAQEPAIVDGTDAIIALLLEKGILTEDEVEALREELALQAGAVTPSDSEGLREEIDRVDEKVDRMLMQLLQNDRLAERDHEELKAKVEDSVLQKLYKSSWAQRISFGGDLRLRYQGNYFYEENDYLADPADPSMLLNTFVDRHQFRYRARLDTIAKIIDSRESNVGDMKVGIRLSTGSDDNPVSTNDTLGDYQNKDGILVDRAYLSWTWEPLDTVWGGVIPQVFLTGGRIPNPWFRTEAFIWDEDLNFEGAVFNFKSDIQEFTKWSSFLTVGAFSIQEEEWSQKDKWLYAGQIGVELRPTSNLTATMGVAYYDYVNIEGVNNEAGSNDWDFTAPMYQQKGNTLIDIADPTSDDVLTALASDFNLANVTLQVDYSRFYPVTLSLYGDWVRNIGFDKEKVEERTGQEDVLEENTGYQIGGQIGYPKIREFGEWSVAMYYRYLERDAVLDAFNDSDLQDGGTNVEGWIAKIKFGLYKDVWMVVRGLSSNEISGSELAVDILQVDLNARF